MNAESQRTFRYVLSAGRTGTVFLSRLLNRKLDGVTAVHEPAETRYQMMLANLRNQYGLGRSMLKSIFEPARTLRMQSARGAYVEINPFLCPMTDLLPKPDHALRVVHIVRDPATWAASITTHKASMRFRPFIDYVPFARPNPSPRPPGWRQLGEYERALWRWTWCNDRIGQLRSECEAYAFVRYEDLFTNGYSSRSEALEKIGTTLALPGTLEADCDEFRIRENASAASTTNVNQQAAAEICGRLARSYGYEY